jgi:poly(A) polymerase
VGGAVRDALLHHEHLDPWRGLPDLDLVVEGSAPGLAEALRQVCGDERVPELRAHGAYGTVELVLDGVLLDLAGARQEQYPAPGFNPVVEPGPLERDLERRDFTVNAMALEFPLLEGGEPRLLDPHGGQHHLARRELMFLHAGSVADDPTRLIRAARYAARLGFELAPEALEQVCSTLAVWPWGWRPGDPPNQAPPALATRLRMELELLFSREPWRKALLLLQAWDGLSLLDPALQQDPRLLRRLSQAHRLGLPLLTALVAGAADPVALAARLQLPLQQQRQLQQLARLLQWLQAQFDCDWASWTAAEWCEALEQRGVAPDAVAYAVCLLAADSATSGVWKPLLRWWGRWRHVQSPVTARELLAQGWSAGPELGAELRRLRRQRLVDLR